MADATISVTVTDADGASATVMVTASNTTASSWPNLSTTGPAGIGRTTFTPWPFGGSLGTGDYSKFPTDANGMHLVEGYDFTHSNIGTLAVAAGSKNWRFRGCLFLNTQLTVIDAGGTPAANTLIEYCEFGTTDVAKTAVAHHSGGIDKPLILYNGHIGEISHCQFYHFASAILDPWDTWNIHDNYIFNPRDAGTGSTGDHTDCIILLSGSQNLTVNHNNIDNRLGQTDCIALFNNPGSGVHKNVRITNNMMAGGGFCMYGGAANPPDTGHVNGGIFTGNRFSTKYAANAGGFGPYTADPRSNGGTNITWSDNRFIDPTGTVDGALIN